MPKQAQPPKLESLLDMKLRDFLPMFHKALQQSYYCGLPILKNPLDLFIYQEIIYKTKPDIIIEIGTYKGGSARYLRQLMTSLYDDEVRECMIITIDPNNSGAQFEKDYILFLRGKASDTSTINDIEYIVENNVQLGYNLREKPAIMVIDDGSHTYTDTLANLNIYSQFITLGQYYIVEDTICHHGLNTGPKPGPAEAVDEFLKYCRRFLVDRTCERFGITYNSGGFLKCIKAV